MVVFVRSLSTSHAQRLLRRLVIPLPLRQPIHAAVDLFGYGDEVLAVGQLVQAVRLPVKARRSEGIFRRRRQVGIADQINAEQIAVLLVRGAARDLDGTAA